MSATKCGTAHPKGTNVNDLTAAIFQKKSLLAAIDPALGKYLTVSVAYRGKLSMRDRECITCSWIPGLIHSRERGIRVPEQGASSITGLKAGIDTQNSANFVPWASPRYVIIV